MDDDQRAAERLDRWAERAKALVQLSVVVFIASAFTLTLVGLAAWWVLGKIAAGYADTG